MYELILNIIARVRRFVQGGSRGAMEPAFGVTTNPVRNKLNLEIDIGGFDTAKLIRAGIRFKGIRFLGHIVAPLPERSRPVQSDPSSHAKVSIRWNPSDTSSIYVWNHAGCPNPYRVNVPIAHELAGQHLSFTHHASAGYFAKTRDLAFTEEELSETIGRLRQHREKVVDHPPVRGCRQSSSDADPRGGPLDNTISDNMVGTEIMAVPSDASRNSLRGRRPSRAATAKRIGATVIETTNVCKPPLRDANGK